MEKLMIRGGEHLSGRVTISGAKNSAVALIPAAILSDEKVVIENLPDIKDVYMLAEILQYLGAEIEHHDGTMVIDPKNMEPKPMLNGRVKELRASYYLMGALLGKFGEAQIGLPGGCNLGSRPIDQHVKGFKTLGAEVTNESGALHLKAKTLVGNRIYLDTISVGATINIMLAAARAKGQTIIENAAKEPEIVDVATLLNSMGVKITGVGTDIIKIQGTDRLKECRHSIIPDRIEAGTYMIIAAATDGDVTVDNVIPKHLESLTAKLRELGAIVEEKEDSIRVLGQSFYKPVDVKTLPYPGFPTDLQQPFSVLMTKAKGTSVITETIFSSRFRHIDELRRMGATAKVEGRTAIFDGPTELQGATVKATDLRAGAALVTAALIADGITEIRDIHHIDRGYENLEEKLVSLGAKIWRVIEEE
ncbi:UDP-N-acetylglucosamine 1-carboxyvinyltransferase [Vulcanibacillus modesticaldus]|uniref:UDP-N-acetylglucosamine 1-carboxyvinyltransferase n=1 Tax=Vulcanibacillus modesticaldus TaxID=337097 RepID=A0A1D2YW53_9BACI|nr:UDP-N-acetylglucosamine 1-carboxyvinyltransferase [Vulcanibacillus modesticaldus]OEF99855.1 UDP-N-acetylglucosamine 1-carboxyvinyltransferase [Vulcanibacillus modesticaldus]